MEKMLAFFILLSGLSLVSGAQPSLMPSDTVTYKYVNDKYFVTCSYPAGSEAYWAKGTEKTDTQRIPEAYSQTEGIHVETNPGGGQLMLIFEKIRKEDQGSYTCHVVDTEAKVTFTLNSINPISFAKTEVKQAAPVGSSYTIRCGGVAGDGNIAMKVTTTEKKHETLKYLVTPEGLHIENVTMDYAGKYLCRANQLTGKLSNWKETDIDFKVQHEPRFINEENTVIGFIGGVVKLTCAVSADPRATFLWLKEDRELFNKENEYKISNKHGNLSTLRLYLNDESAFGSYECRAINNLGTATQTIYVKKTTQPLAPNFTISVSYELDY